MLFYSDVAASRAVHNDVRPDAVENLLSHGCLSVANGLMPLEIFIFQCTAAIIRPFRRLAPYVCIVTRMVANRPL